MSKQKTKKSLLKRVKITATGKILRRHQLGVGTHTRKKTKGALERHKKSSEWFTGESKKLRRMIGL